jgi:hypothetical protein
MTLQASRQFQFQQDCPDSGGRHVALPDEFVNRDRIGPKQVLDLEPRTVFQRKIITFS